ncbi:MAG: hypothetical protein KKF46_01760, partial [Nanoarchaeota archaeon]|nr:hypothetical protein [Nanoarchaeota archaeon]MBU1598127.1 hypothetical protein [Nanoarchaeota archaeon]
MTLERIIGGAAYGFASGFAFGFYTDRKIGFSHDLAEYANKGCEDCDKTEECDKNDIKKYDKLNSARSKLEAAVSMGNAFLVSVVNTNQDLNSLSYLTLAAETGIATYVGIKAGQTVGKIIRHKANLNDNEKKEFFGYLKDLELYTFNEKEVEAKRTISNICDYVSEIGKKKKNPKLVIEMHNLTKGAMMSGAMGRMFREAMK